MKQRVLLVLLVLIGLVLGFVQERTKVSLNFTIEASQKTTSWNELGFDERGEALKALKLFRPTDYYYNHKPIELYLKLDRVQLVQLKWILLFAWVAIFWMMNVLILRIAFRNKRLISMMNIGYVALLVLGGGVYALAKVTGTLAQGHGVSREIIGATQSLIPAVIVGVGHAVFKTNQSNEKTTRFRSS